MPKYPLHLVTIVHPEVFTRAAGLGDPRTLPSRKRSRSTIQQRASQLAIERGFSGARRHQAGGVFTIDYGKGVRGVREKCLHGVTLQSCSYEPRLVHIYDAPRPLHRWKLEFREHWGSEEGRLELPAIDSLKSAIAESDLKINALWLNPAFIDSPSRHDPEANLVLGPFPGEEQKRFVELRILADGENLWIEWKE